MRAVRCLGRGLVACLSSPRLVLTLWCVNLLLGLVLATAFYSALQGAPLEASSLVPGDDAFDWVAWVDLHAHKAEVFAQLTHLSGWLLLFGLLVQTFLAGGVLEILDTPRRTYSLEGLLGGGARRFPAFLGLLLLELALLWGWDTAWNQLASDWIRTNWMDGLTDERLALATTLGKGVVFVFGFYLVRTVFDYARVRTVVEDRGSFLLAAFAGVRFLLAHPVSAGLLWISFSLLHLGAISLAAFLEPLLGGGGLMSVLFLFLLHQGYILVRLGLRVGDYAAKIELVRTVRRERADRLTAVRPEPTVEPEPALQAEPDEPASSEPTQE